MNEKEAIKELIQNEVVSSGMAYRFFRGENVRVNAVEAIMSFFDMGDALEKIDPRQGDLVITKEITDQHPWIQSLVPAMIAGNPHIIEAVLAGAVKTIQDHPAAQGVWEKKDRVSS